MHRDLLTVLGCSGSLLVAFAGLPANAILPPGIVGGSQLDTPTVSQPLVQEEAPQVSTQATNDRIKQLASNIFGCTCATCMSAVRQMIQQGTLSL